MKLYDIFIQAIDIPEQDRKDFIFQACDGNQKTIEEVNALLDNDNQNTTTWSDYLAEQAKSLDHHHYSYIDQQVGAFELIEEIGLGGMGAVYLGKRNDGLFEQQVAVKIINPVLEHIIGQQNLVREAGFMAKLNHPAIGKVFDSGQTTNGASYIVMELVEGESISTVWTNQDISLSKKLKLFMELCQAIHHAHQRQVIHADIKPSNVLIDRTGQLKVLDFGIARMFEVGATNAQTAYKTYVRALTAKYASPEVKCGELPSVYSDIYSLGQVLTDLLSFSPIANSSLELAAVANKACAHEFTARYASVMELKDDIARFLKREVVNAYPASRWFKAKKFFTQKHPIASTVALVVFTTVTYLASSLAVQNHHLTLAKQEADLTVAKLTQLLEMADLKKTNGKTLYAKDLLLNAKRLVAQESELNSDSLAKIKYSLANSFESLGELNEANAMLLEVINSVSTLENKDLAYVAGEKYLVQLLYANEYQKIQPDTDILVEHLSFSSTEGLPDSLPQAKFYHQYLNGVKYHLYQSRPSELGAQHVKLLHDMKNHYWPNLDNNAKATISGALAGALLNQLHNGIEFSFEQISQAEFEQHSRPIIEQAILATKESISWYQLMDNQIAIIQKQMILGRALIENDQYLEGKEVMETALASLQQMIGDKHPNNIQFYRIMAGFFAYDEAQLSLAYASKGAELAKKNKQVPQVQVMHALDAQLFALNNIGDFAQYDIVANELLAVYMALADDSRTLESLHIALKTIDQLGYLLAKPADNITQLSHQIHDDFQRFVTPNSSIPARMLRTVNKDVLSYVDALTKVDNTASAVSFASSRYKYLQAVSIQLAQTPRDKFFQHKQRLEMAFLTAQYPEFTTSVAIAMRDPQTIELPSFTWSDKEKKQSSHLIDVLLKELFIFQTQKKTAQASARLQQLNELMQSKSLPANNGWQAKLDAMKPTEGRSL